MTNNFIFPGGLTRDRKVIKHKLNPGYTPAVGTMVKICITCIKSADEFYANIPEISARNMCDSLKDFKQKINDSTIVKEYKAFVGVPGTKFTILNFLTNKRHKCSMNTVHST